MGGNQNIFVGVAVGNKGKGRIIIPKVGVAEGTTLVGTSVGMIGVGGATIEASVLGMQSAMVTLPAIHAWPPSPPANSMYHQVPSKLLPATGAVPPCGMEPMMAYTCPGPLRTFATVLVVILGVQATTVAVGVSVDKGVGDGVSVNVGASVGALPGMLQASTASVMNKRDKTIFLFFMGKKILLQEIVCMIIDGRVEKSNQPFFPYRDQHFYPHAHLCICIG